ncbi:efflux RND transporter periplasmic adaptor subunit [Parahalioglobus pacificus]|uniref:RND transporter MFP subunit n=1 Tax=Parahalioglobus pacificus TaxID=930806 RepID=A0A918XFM4_9GAMM|nr:efflux RND transporter periplasmic adaptor subunit [Halioglobus pacificus]GHD30295.1 RND transporter MFP subunit [Halioglobus pacificus]
MLQTALKRVTASQSTVAIAAAIGTTALLTTLLHTRAGTGNEGATIEPLPVAITPYATSSNFEREVTFLGLVRASQRSDVGFEVSGMVAKITVREGQRFEADEELAQLSTAQIAAQRDAAAADKERVTAELELARLKEKRQKDLRATGAVSREAFDETRLQARALAAQLKSVDAQLARIQLDLDKTTLRAPYAGVVAQRRVNAGAVVSAGAPVLRIVAEGAREAHVGIAIEQAAKLNAGASYPLTLRGETVSATLRSLRPDVDPSTMTTTAVFDLPADVQGLDGEPVTLTLGETVTDTGGWLPMTALIEGERGLWTVMRLDETGDSPTAIREAVEVLHVHGDEAYVRGTLVDGQAIIATGIHRVTPGAPLVAVEY